MSNITQIASFDIQRKPGCMYSNWNKQEEENNKNLSKAKESFKMRYSKLRCKYIQFNALYSKKTNKYSTYNQIDIYMYLFSENRTKCKKKY